MINARFGELLMICSKHNPNVKNLQDFLLLKLRKTKNHLAFKVVARLGLHSLARFVSIRKVQYLTTGCIVPKMMHSLFFIIHFYSSISFQSK